MATRPVTLTLDARYLRRRGVGISIYLADFIGELAADAAFDVTLVTSDAGHAASLRDDFPRCAVDHLPELREVIWEQRWLPAYLERTEPQIYLAGGNRGLPARSPRQTKLVLILHDLIPLRMPRTHLLTDPFGAARFLLGTAISLTRADLIVTNSHSTAADVRRVRPSARTAVRYPSIPTLPEANGSPPARWPSEYLLYCGGADHRKNVKRLVAAHAEYRRRGGSLPLVIIGRGFKDREAELKRVGSAADLHFTGLVSEEVKWAAIRHARAVLYPSSWEGFGLPILEALAAGTPVLAGRGGAQPEVGGDAAAYVDVDDDEALVAGIDEVISPEWREIVRRRGPERLAQVRDATPTASQLLHTVCPDA